MNRFQRLALAAAPNAASVANYCDHAEHNEHVEAAGAALERLALELAAASDVDLLEAYAERLAAIEARNVLARPGGFEGRAAARDAKTWRDLQLVQAEHDRHYHPDVIGIARLDQLRHYAFQLANIVGAFATRRRGRPADPPSPGHAAVRNQAADGEGPATPRRAAAAAMPLAASTDAAERIPGAVARGRRGRGAFRVGRGARRCSRRASASDCQLARRNRARAFAPYRGIRGGSSASASRTTRTALGDPKSSPEFNEPICRLGPSVAARP